MLIFEGPDGVGKTTMAKECLKILNEQYDLPHTYHHLSKPPQHFDKIRDYLPLIAKYTVYDRFHLSRNAYGRVYNNQELLSRQEMKLLSSIIKAKGGFVVLINASEEFLREQYENKGDKEEMYDIEGIVKVSEKYLLEPFFDQFIYLSAGLGGFEQFEQAKETIIEEYIKYLATVDKYNLI